jgi:hypothetical protein
MPVVEFHEELREVRKTSLSQVETAFVLRTTLRDVRNRLRRGRYQLGNGAGRGDVITRGDLPPSGPGTRSRVTIEDLLLALGDDRLAVEVTIAIANGRYVVRPPISLDEQPGDLQETLFALG